MKIAIEINAQKIAKALMKKLLLCKEIDANNTPGDIRPYLWWDGDILYYVPASSSAKYSYDFSHRGKVYISYEGEGDHFICPLSGFSYPIGMEKEKTVDITTRYEDIELTISGVIIEYEKKV